MKSTYGTSEQFDTSAALLSRLIARRASSFRMQLAFRYMRQTNVALCRYKELNFADTIRDICECMSTREIDGQHSLPTPENFEYFLNRIQCAVKILVRIVYCAREAYDACQLFMEKAFFVETIVVYVALMAKIWSSCAELCKKLVQDYNQIIGTLKPHLIRVDAKSSARTLPDRLEEWLGDEWTEINVNTRVSTSKNKVTEDGNLAVDVSAFNNSDQSPIEQNTIVNAVRTMTEDGGRKKRPKVFLRIRDDDASVEAPHTAAGKTISFGVAVKRPALDMGEAICRDTLQSKAPKIETHQPSDEDIFSRISNLGDIHRFISREDDLRKGSQHKLSKRLNNDQWNRLKMRINQIIGSMEPRGVVRAFHGVWKTFMNNHKK